MGLPMSGFPNINAIAQEDATGRPYVNTMDFLKTGLLSSFLCWLAIVTVGSGLMFLLPSKTFVASEILKRAMNAPITHH